MNNPNTKNILLWIVFGAIIGWLASAIVGVGSNLIIDILVGIAGAYIGGWIMNRAGHSAGPAGQPSMNIEGEFNWRSFLVALLGAVVLLALVKILS